MKRLIATIVIAAAWAGAASAYTSVRIDINAAPPPPADLFYGAPPLVLLQDSPVYYVDDEDFPYDCFRVGNYWYLDYDGYWYRSPSYRGPWLVIRPEFVPRPIYSVPVSYWRDRYQGRGWEYARQGRPAYGRVTPRFYGRGAPAGHEWSYRGGYARPGGGAGDRDRDNGTWRRGSGDRERDNGTWRRGGGDRERDNGTWRRGGGDRGGRRSGASDRGDRERHASSGGSNGDRGRDSHGRGRGREEAHGDGHGGHERHGRG